MEDDDKSGSHGHDKHSGSHGRGRKSHKGRKKSGERSGRKDYKPYIIGAVLLIAIIAFIVSRSGGQGPAPAVDDPGQYGSVDVTFHVMSQCPYGIQVENAIEPVLEELGDNINFRLEFIAGETDSGFSSLHGQPEVEGNMIQLCVQELYPEELIDFVVCQNDNPQDLKGSVEDCAEEAGIDDHSDIKACAEGEQGAELLRESIRKSQEAGAQGSPTMYISGELYQGARDPDSFKRAICTGLSAHPLCESLPACSTDMDCMGKQPGKIGVCENPGEADAKCVFSDDEPVKLTVVNAEDCDTCDPSQLLALLNQVFLNMEIERVDVSSVKGRAFIENLGVEHAPSYVFQGDLEETYAWKNNERLRGAFRHVEDGNFHVMLDEASGASYILDEEKRAEFEELTGVTRGDNRPQIDFYVMSYCPYGNIAEEAIEPAYRLLKGKADFNPHYVIYSDYQGGGPQFCLDDGDKYCSMHGVQELNQGLRELCVAKHMGMDGYFDFVLAMNRECTYQNADQCWEGVAEELGLDTAKIRDCEENEWDDILSAELALNQALGVRGSPTIFVEGAAYSGARTPAAYAQALCGGFDTPPTECSPSSISTLDDTQAGASGSC